MVNVKLNALQLSSHIAGKYKLIGVLQGVIFTLYASHTFTYAILTTRFLG